MTMGHKKPFAAKRAVLWLLILFSYMRAYATSIPRLRLEELVSASDVIAVGQIGPAKITGTVTIQIGEEIAQAQVFSVDVTVLRLLKGECAAQAMVIYALPSGPATGYHAIGTGTRLVFLRHSSEGLTVTNPYYPSLPASTAQPSASGPDLVAKVVDELGGVLAAETEAVSVKQQVLDIAYAIPPNEQFTASLRWAMDTSDLDLRLPTLQLGATAIRPCCDRMETTPKSSKGCFVTAPSRSRWTFMTKQYPTRNSWPTVVSSGKLLGVTVA